MFLARVLGSVTSTIKHSDYNSAKLMVVQPITPDGKDDGASALAVDATGVGRGEIVLVIRQGVAAGLVLNVELPAVRSVIVGVVDDIDMKRDPQMNADERR